MHANATSTVCPRTQRVTLKEMDGSSRWIIDYNIYTNVREYVEGADVVADGSLRFVFKL